MAFVDKTLTCRECGNPFTFTSGEQEFHQSRGFENEPGRCPECRAARRTREGGGSYAGSRPRTADRPMFDVVCSQCGKETTVPFQPRGDRPVYCSDCYSRQPQGQSGPRRGPTGGGRPGGGRRW